MWYQVFEYIKFILNSSNQHRIHSPFVYDLVTNCFYDKKEYNSYNILKQFRNHLYNNDDTILIKDFGSGSRVFKSNIRKISQVAKNAGITQKRAQLLFRFTQYIKPNTILELGTSLGMATSALNLGNTEATLTTIEGCPETAKIAEKQFKSFKLNSINLIVNEFENELNYLTKYKYDLIYIDGNHRKDATLLYFNTVMKTVTHKSIIIFDDIHWSKGMTQAWETIKQNPNVTLTIDTFYWGFVFFRKEQEKQHFTIRL